jgi:hypothetical protein
MHPLLARTPPLYLANQVALLVSVALLIGALPERESLPHDTALLLVVSSMLMREAPKGIP